MKITSNDLAKGIFSHPNLGNSVRLEQAGREVRLIFVCADERRAMSVADNLIEQLKAGRLELRLHGTPSSIKEEWKP